MKEIRNVITPARCQELIDMSEKLGYADAPVTTAEGPKMMPEYRLNERVIHFDENLAKELFDLIEDELPKHKAYQYDLDPIGLNEMFRFYKYKPGHFFNQHRDGSYVAGTAASYFTVLLYLNEGYEGGETAYVDNTRCWRDIKPETGKVFIFDHKVLHRSNELIKGTKYIIRTDVMYSV